MKATGVASSGIVHQVLTGDNYKRWSVVMQNYLKGQGLWDWDIEQDASWKMKNAQALHIIQLSCAQEILDQISRFETAEEAWNHLYELYGKLKTTTNSRQDILSYGLRQQTKVFLREMVPTIFEDPSTISGITSGSGWTSLHNAVINGDVDNVEKLVKEGKDELVRMQDNKGYTALALAAHYTGNTDIVKCMVESEEGIREWLLEMPNEDGEIPVLLAAANGNKEMTTYLYSKTPQKVFDGEDPRNRVFLLARCIAAGIFGVALKLLTHYQDLARESLKANYSTEEIMLGKRVKGKFFVLDVLASMPYAFPSGSQFGSQQQFIYDFLSVEREFVNSYRIGDIVSYIQSITHVADKGTHVADKGTYVGWWQWQKQRVFQKLVSNPLHQYKKIFGPLFRRTAGWYIQILKCLNMDGTREMYDQKYSHYEVLGILKCFSKETFILEDLEWVKRAMLLAAEHGIIEFINAMKETNPNSLLVVDSFDRDIFSYAVLNRKQTVFQLIHSINGHQKEIFIHRIDAFGNNLLHLAAHLGPSSDPDSRSGAALQMQREIQWFKAVEEFVHPLYKEAKNYDGKKPHDLFTENHRELIKAGEEWAKQTANSVMIVGTLIATIMFTAAFTVPGGNNQANGLPMFLDDKMFILFLIADAVSFFTSTTSIIIFIRIQILSYAEKDFLESLPWKLLSSLLPLILLSVASAIVAFCAALGIILKGYPTNKWFITGLILSLGSIPIIILLVLQLPLMYDNMEKFHQEVSHHESM